MNEKQEWKLSEFTSFLSLSVKFENYALVLSAESKKLHKTKQSKREEKGNEDSIGQRNEINSRYMKLQIRFFLLLFFRETSEYLTENKGKYKKHTPIVIKIN